MSNENPADEYAFTGDITDYWTFTQIRDRVLLMSGITDPAMRMYLLVRSMVSENKKNLPGQGLRRMNIDHLCFLLSRETGKPVSASSMYQILTILEDQDLMIPVDTKQDIGASQFKGKQRAVHGILRSFKVLDLPPVPYTGWRNAWHKLDHYRPDWRENPPLPPTHVTTTVVDDKGRQLSKVTQVPQDVAFQDSGTEPEGSDQGTNPDQDPFQDSGKPFQDSGTAVQDPGTDSPPTSEDGGSPTTLTNKPAEEDDGPSGEARVDAVGHTPVGGTRASDSGSAASGKDSSADGSEGDSSTGAAGDKSKKLTPEQEAARDAIMPLLPPVFRQAFDRAVPQNVCQAMVDALAVGGLRQRTPQELIDYRLMPRWEKYWASEFSVGRLTPELPSGKKKIPFGPLMEMLAPLPECGNPRCEERTDFDRREPCPNCEMRKVDQRADRDRERQQQREDQEREQQRAQEAEQASAGHEHDSAALPSQRDAGRFCTRCDTKFGRGADPAVSICIKCQGEIAEEAGWAPEDAQALEEFAAEQFVTEDDLPIADDLEPEPEVDLPPADREPDERALRFQARIAARRNEREPALQSPGPAPF